MHGQNQYSGLDTEYTHTSEECTQNLHTLFAWEGGGEDKRKTKQTNKKIKIKTRNRKEAKEKKKQKYFSF